MMAVRAWYSPHTRPKFVTKGECAAAYSVSAPLMRHWETKMLATPGLQENMEQGELEPESPVAAAAGEDPSMRQGDAATPGATSGSIPVAKDLQALLRARCTRVGDRKQYGSHGTVGMYREGVKWALVNMCSGLLPRDGRKASPRATKSIPARSNTFVVSLLGANLNP
eukprot:TRINITY_DN2167_c0_g2_i1.p2 TRINITY_DN2167_c0_g2~~TRINITY_DN2167_c0_g2_i1.p2  ORF type:complete len:168 (+),score=30.25 TRINITY_DN2167_c0_g2_i1:236-739(+)